jgi:hypothetical protein
MQISPMLYSRQDTVEKVEKKIHEPGGQGVQLRARRGRVISPTILRTLRKLSERNFKPAT